MLDPAIPGPLAAAQAAMHRHDWQEAFDRFNEADADGGLSGQDLDALSIAAFFVGRVDIVIDAKERAFRVFESAGDPIRAAAVALDLEREHYYKGLPSIAAGWRRRAEKLLESQPESAAHGALSLARSEAARAAGDVETAASLAEEAIAIGKRTGNRDLEAIAQSRLGSLKVQSGNPTDGFALLEEAAFAAVSGELSPQITGVTYCQMISICRDVTDYKRASEWTEATERWCKRESIGGFPGVCRVHRAEIVAKGGGLERAESELEKATAELVAYNATPPMADGYYSLGEVRLRRGDLAGAEEALSKASDLGRTPQPALALVRLAQGNVAAALTAVNTAIADETSWDQLAKTRLLPAQAEIAIAAGDLPLARAAIDELATAVETFDTPVTRAALAEARGRIHLAEGDPGPAARELRGAIKLWREVVSLFEVARDRGLLAQALMALGDPDGAELELRAAFQEFDRLGATLEAASIQRLIDASAERRAAPVQARMTFMFTDIVGSTSLAEELGNAAWAQLLRWHDDTLRSLIAAQHGRVVNPSGDGFFAAFAGAPEAVACAIDIQRAIADQRRLNGSKLSVRIGLHTADANRRGDDYSGVGVHVAARVSAIADADEIVASRATLDEAGDVANTSVRSATLKGVAMPVEVATLTWA
jgi:class 3 adenylate cyclase